MVIPSNLSNKKEGGFLTVSIKVSITLIGKLDKQAKRFEELLATHLINIDISIY